MSQQQNEKKFPNETGLAERFKQVREECGMTMEEFGGKISVTKSYISRIESGKSFNISVHLIEDVKRAFGINPDWLIRGKGSRNVAHVTDRGAPELAPADQAKLNDVNQEEREKEAARVKQRIGGFICCMPGCDEAGYIAVKAQIVARLDEWITWCRADRAARVAAELAARGKVPGGAAPNKPGDEIQ
jgi:transcriptional regulator with XRE-family HTH domain